MIVLNLDLLVGRAQEATEAILTEPKRWLLVDGQILAVARVTNDAHCLLGRAAVRGVAQLAHLELTPRTGVPLLQLRVILEILARPVSNDDTSILRLVF